ncbi:hypothetical protein BBJ29_002780 [Phytophthora kernoviae]|uniref:Uncharacterized protein n=1 Tax=Phytophthora kernoviae TaxID=325452 RepID=A0A3F2S4Z7_9STRA|nr:hypothetical protein BBJ29_002780 [Phytophthora kernoviae]RLN69907.1 hypothetical protein BBP00_00000046 [Phytophthora kernoviae]
MAESSKRKRDDSHERKVPLTKERRTKVRQEHMEEEFAATYHGLTALYKLLEVQHLQSPLFLPRTLGYRLDPGWQQDNKTKVKGELESVAKKTRAQAGATLQDFKIGMTSDTMEAFKKKQQRPGLRLSLFTANGKKFEENQFTLLATCLIPVPCSKNVSLPKEFLHLDVDISVVAFQVVEISDIAESLSQKSSFSFAAPSAGETLAKVWFHFLYHSMLRRMSEKRSEYSCAWCNMFAGSLRGLVAHLVSCHDRFRFQATVGHDNIPHIYVMVMHDNQLRKSISGRHSAFSELDMYPNEEPSRFEHHFTHLCGKKYGPHGSHALEVIDGLMQEFDEMDELSQTEHPQEFYSPLLQRQYFHSRTGAVVLDHEKDYDSDDDVDETWITKQSERLLDEFEDVSLEEKEFMKKWNRHVKEFKILADFMVASSCRMFARKHGKWLLDHGLRHNFLLHLLNLWDNSLLNSRAIIDCMLIVDQTQESDTTNGNGASTTGQTSVSE